VLFGRPRTLEIITTKSCESTLFRFCYVFRNSPRTREKKIREAGVLSSFLIRFARPDTEASGGERRIDNYYNDRVARGWESKSVEGQQADASEKPAQGRLRLSADEAARAREREKLRLSRQRVLQEMEASQNPRHRQLLEAALADLEEKLKKADGGRQT
jgi:hypothetical protein